MRPFEKVDQLNELKNGFYPIEREKKQPTQPTRNG